MTDKNKPIRLNIDEPVQKKSWFDFKKKDKAEKTEKAQKPAPAKELPAPVEPKPVNPSLPKLKQTSEKITPAVESEPLKMGMTTKSKWLVVFGVGALAIGTVTTMTGGKTERRVQGELASAGDPAAGPVVNLDLTPKTLDNNSSLRKVQNENLELKDRLDKLERNGLEVALKAAPAQIAAAPVPPPQPRLRDPNAIPANPNAPITSQNPLMGSGAGTQTVITPVQQPTGSTGFSLNPATAEVKKPPALADAPSAAAGVSPDFAPAAVAQTARRALIFTPPPVVNATQTAAVDPVTGQPAVAVPAAGPDVKVKVKYEANPMAGMLPIGHVPVVLLNGADVPMSATQTAQPSPVLLQIMDNSWVPNQARYRLKGCYLLATLTGEASAERAKGRIAALQCVDSKNETMLTAEVAGYIVDNESQLGLRGDIEDRQGAKIMRSTLAAFATGMSGAFGAAAGTTNMLAGGAASTSFNAGESLNKAFFGGAAEATKQYSDFMLKQAEQIFPVLVVPAGRKAAVVFTTPTPLVWKSYATQYERKLTPETK